MKAELCVPLSGRAPSHLLIYGKGKMAVRAAVMGKTGIFYFLARNSFECAVDSSFCVILYTSPFEFEFLEKSCVNELKIRRDCGRTQVLQFPFSLRA